jgi:hypothetical protein
LGIAPVTGKLLPKPTPQQTAFEPQRLRSSRKAKTGKVKKKISK